MSSAAPGEQQVIEIRTGEELDLAALEPWLRAHLPEADGELTVRQFGGGHANLTYLVRLGSTDYVLRRPPLGPVAKTAHDMKREHRVLEHLWKVYPYAPRSFALCTDESVIGAEFHVMQRFDGVVIRKDNAGELIDNPETARDVSLALVECLARLHLVEPAEAGLGELGRPEGFLERQITGWSQRWENASVETTPAISDIIAWIEANKPARSYHALVHNDYKLDNLIMAQDDPGRAVGVLDWDMCTRGDPLTDLGTLLHYWNDPEDPVEWEIGTTSPRWIEGSLTRDEAVAHYAQITGLDVSNAGFYHVFAIFRSAAILQQIYKRWLSGQTQDERFSHFGKRVETLVSKARTIMASN